jgi:hypothetical protein
LGYIEDEIALSYNVLRFQDIIIEGQTSLTENRNCPVYDSCKFIFRESGEYLIDGVTIQNCSFIGLENLHYFPTNAGRLTIRNCKKFYDNRITKEFRIIEIENCELANFNDDSISTQFVMTKSEIKDFVIKGSCESLHLSDVRFLSSLHRHSTWDKVIIKSAKCFKTIFDNVRINPFYFATKCDDKSSLDLSRSTLIDNWSRLRKKYAGLSLFIVFFLTFLFFLPLFTHSFFLLTLKKVESQFYEAKTIPLWEALLFGGKTGWTAIGYATLTMILLIYNIGRIYMTVSIARLREEEMFLKDSDFNLVSIHPEKYKKQLLLDKVLSIMFWISIGYTLLKLVDTLLIKVPAF